MEARRTVAHATGVVVHVADSKRDTVAVNENRLLRRQVAQHRQLDDRAQPSQRLGPTCSRVGGDLFVASWVVLDLGSAVAGSDCVGVAVRVLPRSSRLGNRIERGRGQGRAGRRRRPEILGRRHPARRPPQPAATWICPIDADTPVAVSVMDASYQAPVVSELAIRTPTASFDRFPLVRVDAAAPTAPLTRERATGAAACRAAGPHRKEARSCRGSGTNRPGGRRSRRLRTANETEATRSTARRAWSYVGS